MDQARTIGDKVRDVRKRRGLSQRELAELSGTSASLVRKLEQGERQDIRMPTARKLATALRVPTTTLLARSGDADHAPPAVNRRLGARAARPGRQTPRPQRGRTAHCG